MLKKKRAVKLLILQLLEPSCTPRDPILFQRPGYKVDAGIMGSNVTFNPKNFQTGRPFRVHSGANIQQLSH